MAELKELKKEVKKADKQHKKAVAILLLREAALEAAEEKKMEIMGRTKHKRPLETAERMIELASIELENAQNDFEISEMALKYAYTELNLFEEEEK